MFALSNRFSFQVHFKQSLLNSIAVFDALAPAEEALMNDPNLSDANKDQLRVFFPMLRNITRVDLITAVEALIRSIEDIPSPACMPILR